jgi:Leucine-rich repeat (LRR) protein
MIEEIRQAVIRDNNTAQQSLEFLLDKVGTNVTELIFSESLHGDLDFSLLADKGFRHVTKIQFTTPGEITSVSNLPARLETFICPEQMLTDFENTVPSLTVLNLEKNHISHIDLSLLPKLKLLNVNQNRLSELKGLPVSLEELYINHNDIRVVDLKHTVEMRVLHTVGNRMIRIQNVPPSIVDLRIEDTPMTSVDYSAIPDVEKETAEDIVKNMDYVESLKQYFEMKGEYDTLVLEKRKSEFAKGRTRKQGRNLAREYRPKCIKCGRRFGTIFEQRDRRYIARCGNVSDPCALNIQLYRGMHQHLEDMVYTFNYEVESHKEIIIEQKLIALFNYLSEEVSSMVFKDALKNYNIDNNIFKEILAKFNELHHSPHKREMIRNKIQQIYDLKNTMKAMQEEYQKTSNLEILKTINDIYINEYLPEIHNLRLLKYEIMELNKAGGSRGGDANLEFHLFQKDVALTKLEYVSGEPPRVIAFRV